MFMFSQLIIVEFSSLGGHQCIILLRRSSTIASQLDLDVTVNWLSFVFMEMHVDSH